jgi:serine phosphatase RsbU (regulator of sigma subunit)
VVEARNAKDEEFELRRLEEVVRMAEDRRAYEIAQAIINAVNDYSFDVDGPGDDLTVLIIKVT